MNKHWKLEFGLSELWMTTAYLQPARYACGRKAKLKMRCVPHSLSLLDRSLGQEVDPTVFWSQVTVSSQPCKEESNSNLKAVERLTDILASAQPGIWTAYLGSPWARVSAMADLGFSKMKKVLILKVEDTAQLRWAHVANRGEERKAHRHVQVLHKAVKLRCQEIDKEMAILGKFLEKVKRSTGHLTQSHQHGWCDGNLPEKAPLRKRYWAPLLRVTFFLLDGITSGTSEHLLPLCPSTAITLWRIPMKEPMSLPNTRPLKKMLGKKMGFVFWRSEMRLDMSFKERSPLFLSAAWAFTMSSSNFVNSSQDPP